MEASDGLIRGNVDSLVKVIQALEDMGVELPGRLRTAPLALPLPATLDLVPVSRRPTALRPETVEAALGRPIPETGGAGLGRLSE